MNARLYKKYFSISSGARERERTFTHTHNNPVQRSIQWIHAPAECRTLNTIFPWFFHIYNILYGFFFCCFSFSQSLAILFLSSYIFLQLLHQFLSALERFFRFVAVCRFALFFRLITKFYLKRICKSFSLFFLSTEKKRNNIRQIWKTPQ